MCKLLIFGGTTEGRLLARFCHEEKIPALVSVVSGYGEELLPCSAWVHVRKGVLTQDGIRKLIRQAGVKLVMDATHPYAAAATKEIEGACRETETEYIRVVRPSETFDPDGEEDAGNAEWKLPKTALRMVSSAQEAAAYLDGHTNGNILVTTGSKELEVFATMRRFQERVYARVLPAAGVIALCESLGMKGSHLIAMQGPFSREMNRAVMNQLAIRYLVTKETGSAGGFAQKMQAAMDSGVTAIVIARPKTETGLTLEEAEQLLKERTDLCKRDVLPMKKRRINLIGVGMGGREQLTLEAAGILKECDVVFGAPRMLTSVKEWIPCACQKPFYLESDILSWLKKHTEFEMIGVVYSGDPGFYSGAGKMADALREKPYCEQFETRIYPGISTVSYLAARLKTTWEDMGLASLHGRSCDLIARLRANKRVFVLMGGKYSVEELCETLLAAGLYDVRLTVGERLSYPEEMVTTGSPDEVKGRRFEGLSAVLIEQDKTRRGPDRP